MESTELDHDGVVRAQRSARQFLPRLSETIRPRSRSIADRLGDNDSMLARAGQPPTASRQKCSTDGIQLSRAFVLSPWADLTRGTLVLCDHTPSPDHFDAGTGDIRWFRGGARISIGFRRVASLNVPGMTRWSYGGVKAKSGPRK